MKIINSAVLSALLVSSLFAVDTSSFSSMTDEEREASAYSPAMTAVEMTSVKDGSTHLYNATPAIPTTVSSSVSVLSQSNLSDITSNTSGVTNNTSDIATNSSTIATDSTRITSNTTAINELTSSSATTPVSVYTPPPVVYTPTTGTYTAPVVEDTPTYPNRVNAVCGNENFDDVVKSTYGTVSMTREYTDSSNRLCVLGTKTKYCNERRLVGILWSEWGDDGSYRSVMDYSDAVKPTFTIGVYSGVYASAYSDYKWVVHGTATRFYKTFYLYDVWSLLGFDVKALTARVSYSGYTLKKTQSAYYSGKGYCVDSGTDVHYK